MPRREPKQERSRLDAVKALPWALLIQGGIAVNRRWRSLSAKERARLTELVKQSAGRPGNLSEKDRQELRKLARRLDLKGMTREFVSLRRGHSRRKRRGA
jgi:hypothetical protein